MAYLRKATEFEGSARETLVEHGPNSAGLEAVHAVISARETLTVARLELRSKGEDHRDVLQRLDRIPATKGRDLKRQVAQVLSVKNRVEYGGEGVPRDEAERLVVLAGRVVRWVTSEMA